MDKSCCNYQQQNKFRVRFWFAFQAQDEEFQTFQSVHVLMAYVEPLVHMYKYMILCVFIKSICFSLFI